MSPDWPVPLGHFPFSRMAERLSTDASPAWGKGPRTPGQEVGPAGALGCRSKGRWNEAERGAASKRGALMKVISECRVLRQKYRSSFYTKVTPFWTQYLAHHKKSQVRKSWFWIRW